MNFKMAKPGAVRGKNKRGRGGGGGCSYQIGTLTQRVSTPPPGLCLGPSINDVRIFKCFLDPLPPFLHVIRNRNV